MIVNKGGFLNVNKVICILRVIEFSHTPVGGDTFFPSDPLWSSRGL